MDKTGNTCFDDIPEDRELTFLCECGGEISKISDSEYECDTCSFKRKIEGK